MRLFCSIIAIFTILLSIVACEDLVEIETPSDTPRLVIDALIRVDTSRALTPIAVKVSQTNNFFESIPPANLQQITLTDAVNGGGAILNEFEAGSGIYLDTVSTRFLIENELILQIDFEDEFYVAYAQFQPSVPIDSLAIGDGVLIEDETELVVSFTDVGTRDDYYLFDFDFRSYLVTEDEFYQGQPFTFSYFYDEEFEVGQELEIGLMGVDKAFYDYMALLIEQSEPPFGPFETPAVTVRGNFINVTDIDNTDASDNVNNPDNYALGYFAIVQEYKRSITIEE